MNLALLLALVSAAFCTIPLPVVKEASSSRFLPHRYIVELEAVSSLTGKRSNIHTEFYGELDKRVPSFKVEYEFNSPDLFVGTSITITSSPLLKNLAEIARIHGVKSITPVAIIPRPKPVKIAIPSGPGDPIVPPDSQSAHIMIGVDKLHARGILGKGIKIGIIDTGTDYTNPFLGGQFGPGNKIAGGYDFVGDAYNGTNIPMPDPDPLDQCAGHGTHVAGIIGANPGNEFNISGVAYESTLFSYRVFGCTGGTSDDIILEALLRGEKDGMDVLNLSLGGPAGWSEATAGVVASRLARMGKIVSIAAGNDGSVGSWYTSSPSNGIDVISVGSVDNLFVPLQNATTSDPTHPTIPYFQFVPLPVIGPLPIYATSNDTTIVDDACNPLPDDTPDLSKFLVIVRRGACAFVIKLQNLADKGAKVSLIYDNGSGFGGIETGNFTSSLIQASDGQFLVGQFVAGKNITISFPQHGASFNFPSDTGGLVSGFTSYGPTNDMFFKPAVTTPGGNILSTYPVDMGSFAVLSGTSMATPALAGCAALLLQLKGKSVATARNARTLFETTAQMIPSSRTDGDPLQTLTQQGAGLVNVFNAVTYTTLLSPGELPLNDTNHFVGRHVLTIKNTGLIEETYKITHVPAGTALTIQAGTIFPSTGPAPLTSQFATAKIEPKSLTIPPSGEANIVVTIHPPTSGIDKTTFPVYSGFIQVQSVYSSEILHSSYQGLAAVAKDLKIIDNTDSVFGPGFTLPFLMNGLGYPQFGPANYTFIGGDFPVMIFRLASGSPRVTVDLVQSNYKLSKRDSTLIPMTSDWSFLSNHKKGSYGAIPIVGNLLEEDYLSRNSNLPTEADGGFITIPFSVPVFANGTIIPNGQYRFLLRALKITGNPDYEDDYEIYLSLPVGVCVLMN